MQTSTPHRSQLRPPALICPPSFYPHDTTRQASSYVLPKHSTDTVRHGHGNVSPIKLSMTRTSHWPQRTSLRTPTFVTCSHRRHPTARPPQSHRSYSHTHLHEIYARADNPLLTAHALHPQPTLSPASTPAPATLSTHQNQGFSPGQAGSLASSGATSTGPLSMIALFAEWKGERGTRVYACI